MKHLILSFLLLFSFYAYSNDTITVMQYNLLYYGINNSWCNSSNNNIESKDHYIRTILNEVKPDILTVCEFGNDKELINHFLDNNLNINNITSWKASSIINNAKSNIINAIFYNSDKINLKKHSVAQSYIRDIDVFELFFNTDDLILGDTIDLICVVAHLKSSSGSQNENSRKIMIENTLNYLNNNLQNKNILLMGDFNLYSSNEDAYQLMTDNILYPDSYFIDPIGDEATGKWHDNPDFQYYHTQSTNIKGNKCRAGGGLDDRFDFIMMSEKISTGNDNIRYINNSYQALGQDGLHFNNSINAMPLNSELPDEVVDALYNNSDHLPIIMKLNINAKVGVHDIPENNFIVELFPNPADNYLKINFGMSNNALVKIIVFNILGEEIITKEINIINNHNTYNLNIENLDSGMYFIKICTEDGLLKMMKFIVE